MVRNRVKRLMREVFRMHKAELKKGYHIVWVARKKLTKADYKTFERVFLRLVKKSSSAAVIRIEGYEQVTDFVYKILPDFYITAETADLQVLSYMFSVCY